MIVSLVIAAIVGVIVTGITGFSVLGWAVGIILFLICLPGALIGGFVSDMTSYAQDRADDRQTMQEFYADCRAAEHEDRADARAQKLSSARRKGGTKVIVDARQVHFHTNDSTKTIRGNL